jgi:hypothetical protein
VRFHGSIYVLTSQFSEWAIACVSWGVKENRHIYSGLSGCLIYYEMK